MTVIFTTMTFALLVAVANAQSRMPTGSTSHARNLAATCAACHLRGGAGDTAIAPLEGRSADETAATLRAFKSGARSGTVMPQLARGYSDADIDAMAAWYAARHP
ncbi:MAG: c-type cytochrome [Betaproteobacteria bacterium]